MSCCLIIHIYMHIYICMSVWGFIELKKYSLQKASTLEHIINSLFSFLGTVVANIPQTKQLT